MARNFGDDNKTFYISPRQGVLAQTFSKFPDGFPPTAVKSYTTKEGAERFVVEYRRGIDGYIAGIEYIPKKEKFSAKACLIIIDPIEEETYRIEANFDSGYAQRMIQVLDNLHYTKRLSVNAYDIKEGTKRNVGLYFDQEGERIEAKFSDAIWEQVPKYVKTETFEGVKWDKSASLEFYFKFLNSRRDHFFPTGTLSLAQVQAKYGKPAPAPAPAPAVAAPVASSGVPPQKSIAAEDIASTDQGVPEFMKPQQPAPAAVHNPAIPPQPNNTTPVPPTPAEAAALVAPAPAPIPPAPVAAAVPAPIPPVPVAAAIPAPAPPPPAPVEKQKDDLPF